VLFTVSEHINRRKTKETKKGLEEFNLDMQAEIGAATLHSRQGCVLVAVRDYNHMAHLDSVLEKTNLRRHDIVVMTVRPVTTGAGEYELNDKQLFADYERELFSRVVTMAEKAGKTVELLVVPGVDPFDAMVQTANKLQASRLVSGVSARMDSEELARRIGNAWEKLPEPRHPFSLEVISPGRPSVFVNLGPHPPRLWPEDVDRLHELWLRLSEGDDFGCKLHHRDVLGAALRRLEKDLSCDRRLEAIEDIQRELRKS
jgi:nucleotide-binding universal stress UspA family protein